MAEGYLRRFFRQLRVVFAPEELEDAPRDESSGHAPVPDVEAEGFLAWLLRPERLPLDPAAAPARGPSFLKMLLARERLAEDPPPQQRRD